ncbi:MAG TPA: hypothetical protein VIY48_04730 [Candidatus Paceibacterota bacterium]
MRDITPDPYGPSERSIRNIPVSHRRPHVQEEHEEVAAPMRRGRGRRRMGRIFFWIGVFLLLGVIAAVLVSTVFAGVTVHLTPRSAIVTPTGSIVAQLDGPVGTLPYRAATASRSAITTVPANGTKQVSRQASGLVTIYNAYSTAKQRLITNTRLQAPDGKIYRIKDSVTVPGMQGTTPGSVTATVYADSPGDSYNRSDVTTFTIPGFKGDPRYDKFTAKSQGAISGGFVGAQPSVSDADLATAKQQLQKSLDTAVRDSAQTAIPDGYMVLPDTLIITFSDLAQSTGDNNTATVSESASATEYLVSKADVASAIAKKTVDNYTGEAVALDPGSTLTMSTATTSQPGVLTVTLNGSVTLVWQFDPNAVKQALLGRPKSEFQQVLKSFAPAISCTADTPCDASIRPFWQSSFPTDPNKINVIINPVK